MKPTEKDNQFKMIKSFVALCAYAGVTDDTTLQVINRRALVILRHLEDGTSDVVQLDSAPEKPKRKNLQTAISEYLDERIEETKDIVDTHPDNHVHRLTLFAYLDVKEFIQDYTQAIDTPATLPPAASYKDARGITGWQEGDESAEDSIRRLRDGDVADVRYVASKHQGAFPCVYDTHTQTEILSAPSTGKNGIEFIATDEEAETLAAKWNETEANAAAGRLNADSTGNGGAE